MDPICFVHNHSTPPLQTLFLLKSWAGLPVWGGGGLHFFNTQFVNNKPVCLRISLTLVKLFKEELGVG